MAARFRVNGGGKTHVAQWIPLPGSSQSSSVKFATDQPWINCPSGVRIHAWPPESTKKGPSISSRPMFGARRKRELGDGTKPRI